MLPPHMNMMSWPRVSNCLRLPTRKPSPKPTSSSKEPTPHATPNIVRNERSLCAHNVASVWPKMSRNLRTNPCSRFYIRQVGTESSFKVKTLTIDVCYTLDCHSREASEGRRAKQHLYSVTLAVSVSPGSRNRRSGIFFGGRRGERVLQ